MYSPPPPPPPLPPPQGNVEFTEVEGEEGATVADPKAVPIISSLLAVTPEQLEKALCFRTIASRREVMEKRHSCEQALYSRDAFAKVHTPVM